MLFIAKRFYKGHNDTKRGATQPAIRIATGGIAMGIAIMLLSTSVLWGFKNELTHKVAGFAAHLEVLNKSTLQIPDAYPIRFPDYIERKINNTAHVTHTQKIAQKIGVIKTGVHFKPILLKGIDECYDTTYLSTTLLEGRLPLLKRDSATNEILVSRKIADALNLKVGEQVYSYFFDDNIRMRRMSIVGIYETNLKQFDGQMVIADRYTVCKLNGWTNEQYSSLELKVSEFDAINQAKSEIEQHLAAFDRITTLTIDERYPQVFSWLEILNTNVWVILALMVGVAAFTLCSGLLVIMLERTPAIGILKAMGATNKQLRKVFMSLAMIITGKGILWGNVIALGMILIQYYLHPVKLNPEHYYVSEVHVVVNPYIILLINGITLILIFASLFIPTHIISKITPAKSIKFD